MLSINRTQSLQPGMQRLYKYCFLIEELQQFLFSSNDTPSNDNRYFFYGSETPSTIKQENILKLLLQIKKTIGKQIFLKFDSIKSEILNNSMNNTYLKYMYGILKIHSLEEEYLTRVLIWIYSLCYGGYERESKVLRKIVERNERVLIELGMNALALQDESIKSRLKQQQQDDHSEISSPVITPSTNLLVKLKRRFKKCMVEFIKSQQHRNHEQRYQICRICQSHISVNLMHAHLAICQSVNQKIYLEDKIEQSGRQLLEMIKQQEIEYDYLDQRADTKLFFYRVYETLGEKNVIFSIKDDEMELGQVIEQFQSSHNLVIKNIVDLLNRYHSNVLTKLPPQGYDSDEFPRMSSQKSKLRSHKIISRNSIRLSSNSLNHDSDSRSTGSQKQIRYIDESFIKSAKAFHTIDDFAIIKLIGKGAYSQVYLVKNTTTEDLFAMKVVEVQSINTDTLDALKKEQEIYKKISSQFAIQLYQSFSDQNLHFFVLEYASGGNLRHLLEEQCYFDQDSSRLYLANLILALEQIHHMGIIHRDLKPQNIVIDAQGFLKLTDFNLAFMLTANIEQSQEYNKFFGSPDYIAPEVIKSQLNHPSRDIWSLGIIAYEIMIGVTPFTAMEVQEVFQNILKGEIQWPEIGQQQGMISLEAKEFISALLQPNPFKRLGFHDIAELKKHPFFKNINWSNIRQHKPYFVPKPQTISLQEDPKLKERLLQRKTTEKSSTNFPSLGNIIRYDILKSKSSLKAKSTRKSRFKMQKELNELKILTSMDSFPPPNIESQKSIELQSNPSSSMIFQSEEPPSNSTIGFTEFSYRSIQPRAMTERKNEEKNVIRQVAEQNYEIKVTTPQNLQLNSAS